MKGFYGIVTLVLSGVIIADLVTNWKGTVAGMQALNNILATSYTAMLGQVPSTSQQWPKVS